MPAWLGSQQKRKGRSSFPACGKRVVFWSANSIFPAETSFALTRLRVLPRVRSPRSRNRRRKRSAETQFELAKGFAMRQAVRHQIWIAALAIVVFFANLGATRLWDQDEAFFARAAVEMHE